MTASVHGSSVPQKWYGGQGPLTPAAKPLRWTSWATLLDRRQPTLLRRRGSRKAALKTISSLVAGQAAGQVARRGNSVGLVRQTPFHVLNRLLHAGREAARRLSPIRPFSRRR